MSSPSQQRRQTGLDARKTRNDKFAGDFPDVNRYRDILEAYDLSSFPQFTKVSQRLSSALQQGGRCCMAVPCRGQPPTVFVVG
jgi:hypothetical protein